MISKAGAIEVLKSNLAQRGEKYNSMFSIECVSFKKRWKLADPDTQKKATDIYLA